MKTIDLIQGSPEWLAHRAQHFNASDAPAMYGCSPYMTRTELLTMKKTGIAPEVDPSTQRRFDDGHRFEALARPLGEQIIGEELSPVTGANGQLSASFDGLTFMGDTAFEHKTLNDTLRYTPWDEGNGYHLPLHYQVQLEQQLLVSGAERVLFMATNWDGDTLAEERHCWYASDAALRAKIVAGWEQFAKDLIEFTPEVKAAPVVAEATESLPTVSVRMDGAIAVISNLDLFGEHLKKFVAQIDKEPATDQAFANCESAVKTLKKAEDALDAAEAQALAQIDPVESMRRTVADYKELARTTRLMLEKVVKARKESIKSEIVASGVAGLSKHIRELNAAMPADYMPQVKADFGGCIKGLKSVDSIRNAVDTELAKAKIEASNIANLIHANLKAIGESDAPHLFTYDIKTLVLKATEDLTAVIAQRISAEKAKEEAQRERIRAEEVARLEREAAARDAAKKAEAERIERDTAAKKVKEAAEDMAIKREEYEAKQIKAEQNAMAADAVGIVAAPAQYPSVENTNRRTGSNATKDLIERLKKHAEYHKQQKPFDEKQMMLAQDILQAVEIIEHAFYRRY